MRSIKPYFFRAVYQWATDNELTPQLLVDATVDGVVAPVEYVNDGQITLNVHDRAVRGLTMDNDRIVFAARFSGKSVEVRVPMRAVLAIYVRENGQGIYFKSSHEEAPVAVRDNPGAAVTGPPPAAANPVRPAAATPASPATAAPAATRRPTYLRLVKNPASRKITSKG